MPYHSELDRGAPIAPAVATPAAATADWRHGLPVLSGSLVTLRELRTADAASLLAAMTTEEVSRFISPPPTSVEGFEKFIAWTHRERAAGRYICFAITARGTDTAIGIIQIRSLEAGFGTSEWGFALAVEYWGTGMFSDGAALAIEFAFQTMGVHRLEARATLRNGRGNGALKKIGAVHEGVLRRSFVKNGEHLDQALWTILSDEWMQTKAVWGPRIIH
jgi:RimJ/RimL family protein N-acetyltransferase